jgi:hypothetical protein
MIVGVGSWRGTGATTTALLLAAAVVGHGRIPWLIEADPAGGVLTYRCRLDASPSSGMESLAFPANQIPVAERLERAVTWFGGIRIVTAATDPYRAHGCHDPRHPWAPGLHQVDGPVIVDLGRLRAGSPVWPLLHEVDVLLLTVTREVASAVASDDWVRLLGRVSPADPGLPADVVRFVVVDAPVTGEAFSRHALQAELGDRCAAWIPWGERAVDLVQRGADLADRRLRRDPTALAVARLATDLFPDGGDRTETRT